MMNCSDCAFNQIITDENDMNHNMCTFSKANEFLHEVDFFNECSVSENAEKASREIFHDNCFECKYMNSGWDNTFCAKCSQYDEKNKESMWRWEKDDS